MKSFILNHPVISRFICFVFLPLIAIIFAVYWYLGTSDAVKTGQLSLDGLAEPATLSRDDDGVVFIRAANDLDAFFTLGLAHGQDRLWQMETARRRAAGRLSEILGKATLDVDKYSRTFGFYRHAVKIWNNLPDDQRLVLEHYTAGVNAAINNYGVLPVEFLMFNHEPEAWEPIDSIALSLNIAADLSNNMGDEIKRTVLLSQVGFDKTNQLMNPLPLEQLQASNWYSTIELFMEQSLLPFVESKPFVGSNAWVISGAHTESGKPILANDQHLTNTLPSIWYLASMQGDKLQAVGGTFPGFPFIMVGKNAHIAWGMTNMMADTQDLYIEKINPLDRNQYQLDGEYRDMEVWIEKINIKNDFLQEPPPAVEHLVRRTHRGPVISDLGKRLEDYVYSLQWAGEQESGGAIVGFHELSYATNWEEFNDALEDVSVPISKFVYGDVEGNIGYLAPGYYPLRNQRNGSLPAEGWLSSSDWQGRVPYSEVPRELNPKSGIIVTANNRSIADHYPHYITHDWAPEHRADRIEQFIREKASDNEKLSLQDMVKLQGDTLSPAIHSILPGLKKLQIEDEALQEAHQLIVSWDGDLRYDSEAALLYMSWMSHLNRLLLKDDMLHKASSSATSLLTRIVHNYNLPLIEQVLTEPSSDWCDYSFSTEVESCTRLLNIALQHAVNELSRMSGSEPSDWQWGELHQTVYPHFPFQGKEQFLSGFFSRKIASGGSGHTVNVAPALMRGEDKFFQYFGASYRQIVDLGSSAGDSFMISTGQSGNVFSDHYDDLIEKHRDMSFLNMTFVSDSAHQSLQLIPK